jgi:predicted RNA-binding protein YlxR (DUF448 family)
MNTLKEKHVPERKCTGCGEHFKKSSLIRVLRAPDGQIFIDKTGKASGRGAYICKSTECLKKAIKSSRIERSFGCSLPKGLYEILEGQINDD